MSEASTGCSLHVVVVAAAVDSCYNDKGPSVGNSNWKLAARNDHRRLRRTPRSPPLTSHANARNARNAREKMKIEKMKIEKTVPRATHLCVFLQAWTPLTFR